MACDCVQLTNEALTKRHPRMQLDVAQFFSGKPPRPRLSVLEFKPRKNCYERANQTFIPDYCPFCGKKYDEVAD